MSAQTNCKKAIMPGIFDAPFVQLLGLQPGPEGRVILEAEARHTASNGCVHTGVLATILEMAAASVVEAMAAPQPFFMDMLRPAKPGQRLIGEAKVLSAGKRVVAVESKVYAKEGDDDPGKLVAAATINFMVIEQRPASARLPCICYRNPVRSQVARTRPQPPTAF